MPSRKQSKQRPSDYIKSLPTWEQPYAQAHLAWLRGADKAPWEGDYGISFGPAQAIRRRLGTLA